MNKRSFLFLAALLSLVLVIGGCGDTQEPNLPPSDTAEFTGNFDAGGGEFLLSRIDQPGMLPLRIDLVGSNLTVDETDSTLSIDVVVVNRGREPLYPQAIIWVSQFRPSTVSVVNPDIVPPFVGPMDPNLFGFDYSELLGDDGVLLPGESSQPHRWIFQDPGLVSFSFVARAEFQIHPPGAFIAGRVFLDANRDGLPQPDEGPFPGSVIRVTTPSGDHLRAIPDSLGRYRTPAREPGLYELQLVTMLDGLWCSTTPNPLQVIVSTTADGTLVPFEHADFGAVFGPCDSLPPAPPVEMSPVPPEMLEPQDWYHLLNAQLEGTRLHLRVGFSGCSPDHFFQLFAGMPSGVGIPEMPHTWLRLVHDSHGEMCEAWFERDLVYDLSPILDVFNIQPGFSVHLTLEDPAGQVMEFELERKILR